MSYLGCGVLGLVYGAIGWKPLQLTARGGINANADRQFQKYSGTAKIFSLSPDPAQF
jgi:hypothetical protein